MDWQGILQKSLKDLKTKNPNLSEVQLASKTNVPRATLNRMYNSNHQKPDVINFTKIVTSSDNTDLLEQGLSSLSRDFFEALKPYMEVSLKEKEKCFVNRELEIMLEDRDVFVAYILSLSQNGIDEVALESILGSKTKEVASILMKRGLIKKVCSEYHAIEKIKLLRSFDSLKYHLKTYSDYYKPSHVGEGLNYAHALTEGLNKEGVKALQEAHKQLHQKIQGIMNNPSYQGKFHAFSVSFCDLFQSIKKGGNTV